MKARHQPQKHCQFQFKRFDTLPNMIINIGMIWAIQVPLTYILSYHTGLGVYGIRWALVISTFAGTLATFTYFRLGRWKNKRV